MTISSITEANATCEKRGTTRASAARRSLRRRPVPQREQPDETADPDRAATRWTQSSDMASAAGEVWAACPPTPGITSSAPAATIAEPVANSSAVERIGRSGRSIAIATSAAMPNRASTIQRSS